MDHTEPAFWDAYFALIRTGTTVPLTVTGSSMTPFLVHMRDTVYLAAVTEPPRKGQIFLYRRRDGSYVLHRVCRIKNGICTMIGDAQTIREPDIQQEQLLAIVTKVVRKGKSEHPGTFWWNFFSHIWIRVIPLRPFLRKLYTICKTDRER